ncbi:MAG: AzlD domain-containing protein [Chloroflexota bacterium]
MNVWLVMILGGLATFGIRHSFIYLFGRIEIPETIRRALRFVPPAVLTAIVFPEVLMQSNRPDLSLGNERMLAALVAVLVAWWTKNTLLTIVVGMTALIVLPLLGV